MILSVLISGHVVEKLSDQNDYTTGTKVNSKNRQPDVWPQRTAKQQGQVPETELTIPPTPLRRVPDTSPLRTAPSSIHSP